MRIVEQWRAYVGPKDERIEREMNRIYKVGFIMLTVGILVALYYGIFLRQVSFVFEMQTIGSATMTFSFFEVFLFAWMLVVSVVCLVLQSRKGFVENGRFAETDEFPVGFFTLIGGMSALVIGLTSFLLRTLATIQVYGFATLWLESALAATSIALMVLVFVPGAFYLVFRAAKRRRATLEAALDND